MTFDFDQIIDRRNSDSIKWNKYRNSDILPLWIADSDFLTAPCIINALKKRVQHGIFGYGLIPEKFFDVTISWIKNHYNWSIKKNWIILLPGVVTGLNLCVRTFTNANEKIITPIPIYPPFRQASILAKRKQLNFSLHLKNNRWLMNFEHYIPFMTGNEKLLMLCNPQNPGGTVYRKYELEEQLKFAQDYNLIVCSDEIHCDLILEPGLKHIPFASLNKDAEQRTITLMSPSKTFNIAGLGAAIAIIPNALLRAKFQKMRSGIVPNVDILSLTAAMSAWSDGQNWLTAQLKYLKKNRDKLIKFIQETKNISINKQEATYLAWINIKNLGMKDSEKWFKKYGLIFSSGKDFGDKNFIRFNFACSQKILINAIFRFKKAINAL